METTDMHLSNTFKEYEKSLWSFALSLTRNTEETKDLIQETFYRALINAEKFNEGTNIKAWLFTIMRNIFINNYRRKKLSRVTVDSSDNSYLLNSTKQVEKNESERSFMSEDIAKALNKVNSSFTEPFLMYHNGFHYDEIAEKLDLPLGTVKSRIFFARKELQSKLTEVGIVNSAYN